MINRNIKNSQKWDLDLRKNLFLDLLKKFGPYSKENKPNSKDVVEVCESFTNSINKNYKLGIKKHGAIIQFRWAITTQEKITNAGLFYNMIMAKAAAREVGYIDNAYLPKNGSLEY